MRLLSHSLASVAERSLSGGSGTAVFGEVPGGTQNGINTAFTLAHTFQTGTTRVYRNGIRQRLGVGYTETAPNTLTFTDPPISTAEITVDYQY